MRFNPFDKDISFLTETDLHKLITDEVAEGWYVEYKSDFPSSKQIGHSIAAFANSDGGWFVIGVKANKTTNIAESISGFDLAAYPNPKDTIRNIASHVGPTPFFTSQLILLPHNKAVLVVYVEMGLEAPYVTSDGKIYRRVGEGSDPEPETNHYIIQKLFERRLGRIERIEEFSHLPFSLHYSQTAPQHCFLEAYLYTQPLEAFVIEDFFDKPFFERLGRIFSSPVSILSNDRIALSLPFTNIFTSSQSYMLRSVPGETTTFNITLTLELFQNGNLKVIMPIPTIHITDTGINPRIYQDSPDIILHFKQRIPRSVSSELRIIDGYRLYVDFLTLFSLYCKLLQGHPACEAISARFRLSNIQRTLLYLDSQKYLEFVTNYDLPLCLKDAVQVPEFSNGSLLPPVAIDPKAASHLAKYLWNALGFPIAYAEESLGSLESFARRMSKSTTPII